MIKYSKQRESITEYLMSVTSHPTAEEIYAALKPASPELSLGTVYRNLRLLAERHEVLALESTDGKVHYDGNTVIHDHFVCNSCGKVYDLSQGSIVTPESYKLFGNSFNIESHTLYLYGTCEKCLNNQA